MTPVSGLPLPFIKQPILKSDRLLQFRRARLRVTMVWRMFLDSQIVTP